MDHRVFLVGVLLVAFSLCSSAATYYQITLSVDPTYAVNSSIEVLGDIYSYTVAGDSPPSIPEPAAGAELSVSILDANLTSVLSSTTATANSFGIFNATLTAPETAGNYVIRAQYDASGTLFEGSAKTKVLSTTVSDIYILPNKATYYAGQAMAITVRAVRAFGGGSEAGVENYSITTNLRNSGGTSLGSFSCTTDSAGYCNGTINAPSTIGVYTLEANDNIGYTTISVISFDVSLTLLDDTGTTIKSTYTPGQVARVRARVTYNGTAPTSGTFSFNGTVTTSNGTAVKTIPATDVNTSTYTGTYDFTIDGNFTSGSYIVYVDVTQTSGAPVSRSVAVGETTVSASTFFKVQDWSMAVEKVSGFDHDFVCFGSSNLTFNVIVTNLTNGSTMRNVNTSRFNVRLYSNKVLLSSYNVSNNGTHYLINLTSPSTTGNYYLEVNVTIANTTQSEKRTITVVNSVASATPVNSNGELRELFDGSEHVYVLVSMKNTAQDVNVTDASLSSVRDGDGNMIAHTYLTDWSADNTSVKEWRYNLTNTSGVIKALLKIDNPKTGGMYFIEVTVNNGTGVAVAKFIIAPYDIMAWPHGKDDTWGWRWQFGKTDTIYFNMTVTQAQHTQGSAMMASEGGMYGSSTGGYHSTGGMSGFGASTQNAVSGATINVSKVINDQTYEELPLSVVNWSCTKTSSSGQASCTLAPSSETGGNWSSGRYHVIFLVTGSDNLTSDIGHSGFEVRSFYIYAWSNSWLNKQTDNLTFNVYMYNPTDTMFWNYYYGSGNSTGLFDGRLDVVKILYHGSPGTWIWPPSVYNYTGELPTGKTVSNSVGNFTLNAPAAGWKTGSYTAVIKGYKTDENGTVIDTDYGEAWFEIRLWDVYSSPVSINGSCYQWTWSTSSRDNVTLYININNAGSWGVAENLTGGPVTIGVKSIMDYSSWPPSELVEGDDFTAGTITVSESSPNLWSSCYGGGYSSSQVGVATANASNYTITIAPTGGSWKPGYYNVVLDVNGTDTGWGYFNVISFNAQASFVSENGTYAWSTTGDGPVYFNVSSSEDYFGTQPLNTTIKSISLMRWSGNSMTEYAYPGTLSVNSTLVPGSAIISVSRNASGNWPTGWYNGQMELEDSDGDTAIAWLWFEVRPFVVSAYSNSWEVGKSSAINATIQVTSPLDWYTQLAGNYTIDSIYEETYGYMGPPTRTGITNYTPNNFTQNGSGGGYGSGASLLIYPNDGRWTSGWHNLILSVRDGNNNTGEAWLGFNVVPFGVSTYTSQWTYASNEDVNVTVSVYDPMSYYGGNSTSLTADISAVWEDDYSNCYTWPCPQIEYNYTPTQINGSGTLTISPPEGGWTAKYHNLVIRFTDPDDASSYRDSWIYFDSRPFTVYLSTNSYWKRTQDVNVSVTISGSGGGTATANITRVYETNWSSWPYTQTNYTFTPTTQINGSGNLTINAPEGGWSDGYHNLYVVFADPDTGAEVEGYLYFSIASYTGSLWSYSSPTVNSSVDLYLYVYEGGTSYATVNISSVQYEYPTYSESWTNANWTLLNYTYNDSSGYYEYQPVSDNNIYGYGYLRLYPPAENWSSGYYDVRVNVTNPTDATESAWISGYYAFYTYATATTTSTTTITNTTTTSTTLSVTTTSTIFETTTTII